MICRIFGHRKCPCALSLCLALAVAGALFAPAPAFAAAEPAEETEAAYGDEDLLVLDEVIVYGTDGKRVEGIDAESELDEATLATYGANSVGELIGQVAPDVDNSTEGPVILVNGRPANGINSVNDLPAEVVASVQVLPPQAAAALGYSPTRRVLNVVLKQTFRQRTANLTLRGATAGRGQSATASIGSVKLNGNNFRDFSLNVEKNEPLLEAHRDLITQTTTTPYDLTGNVLSHPLPGGEIDPALSAMAGTPVTVAGVPAGVANPGLDDFLPSANLANVSDMGRFRTLVADSYSLTINTNLNFQLPKNMSLSLNMYGNRSHSVSRTGATTSLLHVPAASPFSPFSQDVAIARYLGGPLRQESDPWFAYLGSNLNMQLGRWRVLLNGNFNWRESTTVSGRRVDTTALQAAIDAGTVNPFDPLALDLLGEVLTDRARSRGHNAALQLQVSGTAFKMPAGNATLSLRAETRHSGQRSRTTGTIDVSSRSTQQDEVAFVGLQVPLLGGSASPPGLPPGAQLPPGMMISGAQGFAMAGELSGSAREASMFGTLFDYGYGLNWRYGNRITMRVAANHEKVAPQPEMLTNPIVTIDDYRAYDFIREETVLVRYITGGNPDLQVERRRRMSIGATLRPLAQVDFTVNGEYQRIIGRDAAQPLPAVSEDVQTAFPDRYIRDADGRLVEIDARFVSFARSQTEQIRWGGNFRRAFGVPAAPSPAAAGPRIVMYDGSAGEDITGAGWRLTTNFTHTWQLANKRLARAGLPEQDLLAGGVGTGSSQSRHTLMGRVGLAYNGTGLQTVVNWKSRTRITAGTVDDPNQIVFSPLLRLDLSAFANLGTVFPDKPLLTNSRVTLSVENLLDAKQRVRDETGATPLRYQAYLIPGSALGRRISLSLRKGF